jgi:lysophospholipase L1-like esterase
MKHKPTFFLFLVLTAIFYLPPFAQTNTQGTPIVLLGDSITAWGNWGSLLNRRDVWNQGVAGDRTSDVLARMEKVYRIKPKYCFIMIGINDILSGRAVDKIFEDYQRIIDGLMKREIAPIIQSTLYLAGPDPQNGQVEALNNKLKDLAVERKIFYLDLNRRLAPGKRLLPAFTNDGLHLSKAGYQAWKDELIKFSPFIKEN